MIFRIFILWTFVLIGRPQDLITALQPFRPALALAAVTVIMVLAKISTKRLSSVFKTGEARKYFLFYLVMIAGIPFAYHKRVAFDYIFTEYLTNMAFFLVFLYLVDSFDKLKSVVFVVSFSALFYSVFGLLKGSFTGGRFAIYGGMFDPNDIAYVLVSLFPLAFFYIQNREGAMRKILAVAAIGASVILILLSGSRAGVIGLGTVLFLIFFTGLARVKWSQRAALILGILLIVSFYHDRINVERYQTLTDIGEDYNVTDEFGRVQIWKRGLELIRSNPVTGVGVNCFSMALGNYREKLNLIPKWQTAHNSYILIATETGLIGFVLFISIIIGCLRNFSRCRKIKTSSPGAEGFKNLAGLCEAAFIGQLVTAFFLSQGYSIFFTIFFAFSGALRMRLAGFDPVQARPGAASRNKLKNYDPETVKAV